MMKTYEKYKSSGIEWIGDIPEHWEVERAKWIFTESKSRNRDLEYAENNLLSVSEYYGVGKRAEKISQNDILNKSESLTEYKIVKQGDLVINIMLAWKKGLGVSNFEGISSPAYCVFQLTNRRFFQKYFHYLYRTDLYAEVFRQNSTGIIESRLRLYPEEFFNILTIIPSPNEQTAIAEYLDEKTAQIDKLIANKQRLIELLKEERTTVINQAVTRGINPNIKLKPSGIDWLGNIPEHWEVKKLKYVVKAIIDTEHKTVPFYEDGNYFVARTSDIRNGVLLIDKMRRTNQKGFEEWTRREIPIEGDIIFTREAPAGEACVVPQNIYVCLGQRTVLFKTVQEVVLSKLIVHQIYSDIVKEYINLLSQGSTVTHFNMADIRNIPLVLPPLFEQKQIVEYIETATNKIDTTIEKIEKEIELLGEYRTALISEVVTGKIKVI